MVRPSRGSGFVPLGRGAPSLPIPRRDRSRLILAEAWRRVAGEATARRVTAVGVLRGTLLLEVEDVRWASALRDLLPSLAGRLAAARPELGVRRFKIRGGPGDDRAPARAVPALDRPTESRTPPAPESASRGARTRPASSLEEVVEAYLARSEARDRSDRSR